MEDLRSTLLRGRVQGGSFIVRSRLGSLDPSPPAPPGGWRNRLRGQLMPHCRAVQAWRETRGWRAADTGAHHPVVGD